MALWEVVSEDEAGETPSVSLRELIHAQTRIYPLAQDKSLPQRKDKESAEERHSCHFQEVPSV